MITKLRLFLNCFSIEARQILTYRFEFWTGFLGQTFITVTISYFLWLAIFAQKGITEFKGLTLTDFILYYLTVHLSFKILIGPGVGFLSRDIYYGTLNKYLLYPQSTYFLKFCSYFTHSFFYGLQLIFFLLLHKYIWGNEVNLTSFSLGMLALILAMYCFFLMSAIVEILAFWVDNIWSLNLTLRCFVEFGGGFLIPLSFYPDFLINILHFTPFPYLLYYPAQIIMGSFTGSLFHCYGILLFWSLILHIFFKLVWKNGNKVYTGVGI